MRQNEEFVKIKHMHEQEVNRLLRENERMKKLLVRAGVGIGMAGATVTSTTSVSDIKSNMARSGIMMEDNGEEPIAVAPTPSPKSPMSAKVTGAHSKKSETSSGRNTVNWGGLNTSLARQQVQFTI